jgi:molybdopterin converting factor small subunit
VFIKEGEAMHVGVAVYGAARVVIGQSLVDLSFDASTITLGQVLERMIASYPRARPYLLDEAGRLPSHMRVLINEERPDPDATLTTKLHDEDRVALLVAVAGGGVRTRAYSIDTQVTCVSISNSHVARRKTGTM